MLRELHPEVAQRVGGGLALDGLVVDQFPGDAVEVEPVRLRQLESEAFVELRDDLGERRRLGLLTWSGAVVDRSDDALLRLQRDRPLESRLQVQVRQFDVGAKIQARPGVTLYERR